MRIVTVARKPCVTPNTTENVVEHQAGALNIDACRVAGAPWRWGTQTDIRGGAYNTNRPSEGHIFAKNIKSNPAGRWPSNVILVHRPACRIVGERKVPTGTAVRHRGGGKTIFSETNKPSLEDMSYADADGKETLPQWACEEGCPVADLDRQSGKLKSGVGAVKRATGKDQQGNRSAALGAESRPSGTPVVCYGDEGGASRFFKQVKPG